MSAYNPPTRNSVIFNPEYFQTSLADLDTTYLNQNYLRFPFAQGLQNMKKVNITDDTESSDVNSGSLVTAGGVGIGSNVNVGGQLRVNSQNITLGLDSGLTNQGTGGISLGEKAGKTNQGNFSCAMGLQAGEINQSYDCIAIGSLSAQSGQGSGSVAIGAVSGQTSQGTNCVALGNSSGQTNQGNSSVAIGYGAGVNSLGQNSIVIGEDSTATGTNSIAIGKDSTTSTFTNSVALGQSATSTSNNQITLGGGSITEVITGGFIKTTNTNASNDPTSGALQVAGGAGIAGAINTSSTLTSVNQYGKLVMTPPYRFGGIEYSGYLSFFAPNGTTRLAVFGNIPNISNAGTGNMELLCENGTTGLSILGGGLSVAGDINQTSSGATVPYMTFTRAGTGFSSYINWNTSNGTRIAYFGYIPVTSSAGTGDMTLTFENGTTGLSIASGRLNVSGIIKTTATNTSTTPTSGALQVGGGAGIVENLNVGGVINSTGVITASAVIQSVSVSGGTQLNPGYSYAGSVYSGLINFNTPNGTRLAYFGNIPNVSNLGTGDIELKIESSTTGFALVGSDRAVKSTTSTWLVSSDSRIKEDITDANLDLCYSIAKNLKLRRFKWKDYIGYEGDKSVVGYIAQEVQEIFPKAVSVSKKILEKKSEDGEIVREEIEDFLSLNVDQIQKTLHGAIQKLIINTEQHVTQIEQLQNQNQMLERRIHMLEEMINSKL